MFLSYLIGCHETCQDHEDKLKWLFDENELISRESREGRESRENGTFLDYFFTTLEAQSWMKKVSELNFVIQLGPEHKGTIAALILSDRNCQKSKEFTEKIISSLNHDSCFQWYCGLQDVKLILDCLEYLATKLKVKSFVN